MHLLSLYVTPFFSLPLSCFLILIVSYPMLASKPILCSYRTTVRAPLAVTTDVGAEVPRWRHRECFIGDILPRIRLISAPD